MSGGARREVDAELGAPERIVLAHGSGGRLTRELVTGTFAAAFDNPQLAPLSDAALLPDLQSGRLAFTTDAFVVDPVEFPGGDLGHLSVCGTVNDLAVAGAEPRFLSWAVILEEGLEGELLARLVESARAAAAEVDVRIVAGDTKVVPQGKGDRIYAVSAGIGVVPGGREVDDRRIAPGDAIIASGTVGDHGATILAARHDISGGELRSDCAPLASLVRALWESGADLHAMHDPTRGGVATTCNEAAVRAEVRMVLEEEAIPVHPGARGTCELLGLDPLYLACEGRLLAWVAEGDCDRALAALRAHPQGTGAVRIGTVQPADPTGVPVTLRTVFGVERPLDLLSGADLPRIC